MKYRLPYPPTVNTYWRRVGNRTVLSAGAKRYRENVGAAVLQQGRRRTFTEEVALEVEFRPPDKRRRDLDNLLKGVLDSLAYAGVYLDDSQVRRVVMWFGPVEAGGAALVSLAER